MRIVFLPYRSDLPGFFSLVVSASCLAPDHTRRVDDALQFGRLLFGCQSAVGEKLQ
jgi:hypothetical protein